MTGRTGVRVRELPRGREVSDSMCKTCRQWGKSPEKKREVPQIFRTLVA